MPPIDPSDIAATVHFSACTTQANPHRHVQTQYQSCWLLLFSFAQYFPKYGWFLRLTYTSIFMAHRTHCLHKEHCVQTHKNINVAGQIFMHMEMSAVCSNSKVRNVFEQHLEHQLAWVLRKRRAEFYVKKLQNFPLEFKVCDTLKPNRTEKNDHISVRNTIGFNIQQHNHEAKENIFKPPEMHFFIDLKRKATAVLVGCSLETYCKTE